MMHSLLLHTITLAQANPLDEVLDKPILRIHGFWLFSNNVLNILLSGGLMLLIFPKITKKYQAGEHVPTGTRNLFEAVLVYVREEIARPILGDQTDRFVPFLWTLFFFILFNNLLGLLPIGPLTGWFMHPIGLEPLGGTATANIWVTGSLAILAFGMWQYNGIKANGLAAYLKHFTGGAPIYMAPLMVPLEILGMFVKPFALAIRLFANMIAGHTVIAVLLMFTGMAFAAGAAIGWGISIVVILAGAAMMCLELFVAFLQTYIFVFLTTMFLGQLVVHEHENKEGEGGHHDEAHSHIGSGDLTDLAKLPDASRQTGTHMAG